MSEKPSSHDRFSDLITDLRLLESIDQLGFEIPTPIQSQVIPLLQQGFDVVGQAQTGTGKTAAFGLPLLERTNPNDRTTQVLVITPTRELALQVTRALQQLAAHLPGLCVAPIYGGQDYPTQLKALRKGAQFVVGTPGRVMDHLRRRSLCLDALKTIVLDEADEMLNMGFIEDIEWILGCCPKERQTALFSATIPDRIRAVCQQYMHTPRHIRIEHRCSAALTINQRYWKVSGLNKLDALSRILESEKIDAALIFVRTKTAAVSLAQQLIDRGFKAGTLHGDMPQNMREHTMQRVEMGQIDLLVATDVAARGLDIQRLGHVVNYDMPGDTESYIHRIGRTGRAGRAGIAISFVAPRELRMLKTIENTTKQTIEPISLPSAERINRQRVDAFKADIQALVKEGRLEPFLKILHELSSEQSLDPIEMAAALAAKAQGNLPLLITDPPPPVEQRTQRIPRHNQSPEPGMVRYRLAVGRVHGANPNHIVGAISNLSGLVSRHIGRITINQDHSWVDLPDGMPQEIFHLLKKARVCQVPLGLQKVPTVPAKTKHKPLRSRKHMTRKPSKRRISGKKTG